MSGELPQQQVTELVVCKQLDLSLLSSIQRALERNQEAGSDSSSFVVFDHKLDIDIPGVDAPVEQMREVAKAIKEFQMATGGLIGQTQIFANLVDYNLFRWHADFINDAFVTSTEESTQGLKGTIAAHANLHGVDAAVRRQERVDRDLGHISTLKIVKPPVGSLLHLPLGAPHRSPPKTPETPEKRLLVNGVILPNFMSLRF